MCQVLPCNETHMCPINLLKTQMPPFTRGLERPELRRSDGREGAVTVGAEFAAGGVPSADNLRSVCAAGASSFWVAETILRVRRYCTGHEKTLVRGPVNIKIPEFHNKTNTLKMNSAVGEYSRAFSHYTGPLMTLHFAENSMFKLHTRDTQDLLHMFV